MIKGIDEYYSDPPWLRKEVIKIASQVPNTYNESRRVYVATGSIEESKEILNIYNASNKMANLDVFISLWCCGKSEKLMDKFKNELLERDTK